MVNGCGGEDALENGHEDAASSGACNDPEGTLEPDPNSATVAAQDQQQFKEQESTTTTMVEASTETKKPKTTTIGTIALQSGGTRLVIALLEVRFRILSLGNNATGAAHLDQGCSKVLQVS